MLKVEKKNAGLANRYTYERCMIVQCMIVGSLPLQYEHLLVAGKGKKRRMNMCRRRTLS